MSDRKHCLADCHTGEMPLPTDTRKFDIYACTLPLGHEGKHERPWSQRRFDGDTGEPSAAALDGAE